MKQTEKKRSPRRLAAEALVRILDEGGLSHIVTEEVLAEAPGLDERDRALFHRLVKTVLERLFFLDHVIDGYSSTPVRKMKPFIRETLRTAVCQLLFFDQIPSSAAVNEAVAEVKHSKYRSLAGFVNAVLRSIASDSGTIAEPDRSEPAAYLSVRWSMPLWIAELFLNRFGMEAAEEMFRYFNAEPGTAVRVNASRVPDGGIRAVREALSREGAEIRDGHCQECFRLYGAGRVDRLDEFRSGRITVQDESSWTAVRAACTALLQLRAKPGSTDAEAERNAEADGEKITVCDLCAAPGGKSLAAAELLGERAEVFAFDQNERKCALIRENVERCGYTNIRTAVRDARTEAVPAGSAADPSRGELAAKSCDLLICDLPCSGLGIMGKKKDIRYRLREQDLRDLADLQREILTAAADLPHPGGLLLYSTCTLDPAENEEQAAWISERFGYELLDERTLRPDTDGCDGFYYALFRRPAEN